MNHPHSNDLCMIPIAFLFRYNIRNIRVNCEDVPELFPKTASPYEIVQRESHSSLGMHRIFLLSQAYLLVLSVAFLEYFNALCSYMTQVTYVV